MPAKPRVLLIDEALLDQALEELLQQEKYRYCCCTNVKKYSLIFCLIMIFQAALSMFYNDYGAVFVIAICGFAIRALMSRGRHTSLKPVIFMLAWTNGLLIIGIIAFPLVMIFYAPPIMWPAPETPPSSTAFVVFSVIADIVLLFCFLLFFTILRGFNKAQEFLEEAAQIRKATLARRNPV